MSATLKQGKKVLSVFEDTSAEQMQAVIESGILADIRDCNIAKINRDELRQFLGLKPLIPKPEPLLEYVNSITNPGTIEKFIARDRFVINTKSGAPVRISYLGDNFKEWFLGKIEEPIGRSTLCTLHYCNLLKASVDGPIIAKFGGKDKVAATLAEMLSYMEKQGNGEEGLLLTNGYANIFYIRDIGGVLRAVHCYWYDVGWHVHADSVEDPIEWRAGDRVFSRNRLTA
jgi:hypothetical protein